MLNAALLCSRCLRVIHPADAAPIEVTSCAPSAPHAITTGHHAPPLQALLR